LVTSTGATTGPRVATSASTAETVRQRHTQRFFGRSRQITLRTQRLRGSRAEGWIAFTDGEKAPICGP
jgi:hypothetical protein